MSSRWCARSIACSWRDAVMVNHFISIRTAATAATPVIAPPNAADRMPVSMVSTTPATRPTSAAHCPTPTASARRQCPRFQLPHNADHSIVAPGARLARTFPPLRQCWRAAQCPGHRPGHRPRAARTTTPTAPPRPRARRPGTAQRSLVYAATSPRSGGFVARCGLRAGFAPGGRLRAFGRDCGRLLASVYGRVTACPFL